MERDRQYEHRHRHHDLDDRDRYDMEPGGLDPPEHSIPSDINRTSECFVPNLLSDPYFCNLCLVLGSILWNRV